jgi:hypothetical protein
MYIYRPQHVCLKYPYLRYADGLLKTASFLKKETNCHALQKEVSKTARSPVYQRMTLNRLTSSVPAVFLRPSWGSLADAERLTKDNPHQIRTVITLCEKRVKQRVPGIRYLQFSVRDAHPIPIALLSAILEAIYQAVAEGASWFIATLDL